MIKTRKKIILITMILSLFMTANFTFAFWANTVYGDQDIASASLSVGKWLPPGFTAVTQTGDGGSITLNEIGTSQYPVNGNYMMMSDINLNNSSFTPILNFSGNFYGNGYQISNFSLSNNSANIGLFETITSTGLVHGIKIISASISASGSNDKTAGLIAGVNQGTIVYSSAQGTVNLSLSRNGGSGAVNLTAIAGGLVGNNQGYIIDSYANVNVTVQTSLTGGFFAQKTATSYGGGLAGISNFDLGINRTYATGVINVSASSTGGFIVSNTSVSFAGGLVAQSGGITHVNNSFAVGNITNNPTTNSGSVVGSGGFTNSYRLNTQTVNGASGAGTSATVTQLRSSTWLSTNLGYNPSRYIFQSIQYPSIVIEKFELY
ncbi:MAG: hypothetical protein RBT45_02315 [Acholeplasmataceae bacterium]|jgi:hypothetical protein|nr:hypothetical protein [Acholeplasmataceae bacterium]